VVLLCGIVLEKNMVIYKIIAHVSQQSRKIDWREKVPSEVKVKVEKAAKNFWKQMSVK